MQFNADFIAREMARQVHSLVVAGVPYELAMSTISESFRAAVAAEYEVLDSPMTLPAQGDMIGGQQSVKWEDRYDPRGGYYWRTLRDFLRRIKGRSEEALRQLDDESTRVLFRLSSPIPSDCVASQRVQGLVIGYVQSGKTAHYSALIAKAADAGVKIVIVLTGIHDALRRQTQIRLERELGSDRVSGGVGLPVDPGMRWLFGTGTALNGDLNRHRDMGAGQWGGHQPMLIVCKKHRSVLQSLIDASNGRVLPSTPVLIIDDEGDQASINLGGNRESEEHADPDTRPSTINGQIRALISQFQNVSYVAYTATPFANVLIGRNAFDFERGHDLYPRNFIHCLPKPQDYLGAAEFFGTANDMNDEESPAIPPEALIPIPQSHVDLLAANPLNNIPASLRRALLQFCLAGAALLLRNTGKSDIPLSMLIHARVGTDSHLRVAACMEALLANIRDAWDYERNHLRPELEAIWERDFLPIIRVHRPDQEVSFEQLIEPLDSLLGVDSLKILVLNSATDDVLDYEANPGLKAIAVGGNVLSRGLTLENLLVSYYCRRAGAADTLMQMGRWFGFHRRHSELLKIWTTDELRGYYRDIGEIEDELRTEAGLYAALGRTPLDFGPRVRSHPVLTPTGASRMGSAVTEGVASYSGQLIQSTSFDFDNRAVLTSNLQSARELAHHFAAPTANRSSALLFRGVPVHGVLEFLKAYRSPANSIRLDTNRIWEYVTNRNEHGELLNWNVGIVQLERPNPALGTEVLADDPRIEVNCIARTRDSRSLSSIQGMISSVNPNTGIGDETIDLDDAALERGVARARAILASDSSPAARRRCVGCFRAERPASAGLLLLYPISRHSQPDVARNKNMRLPLFADPQLGVTVLGFAISFPESQSPVDGTYFRAP